MQTPETMTAEEFNKLMQGKVSKGNRKVINAVKSERDGMVFDSRLELYMHDLLKMHKIRFEFQKKYTLQDKFRYTGEIIRAITYTIDFELLDFDVIIDTKGVVTQQGAMRIKMLKRLFADLRRQTRIELPKTKAECDYLICEFLK